jgi:hypothetical protein
MIGDVLTGAAMCAAQMKNERAERERREKEWAERKRLEEIERRRRNLEEKRIKDLDDNLSRWRRSIEIRAFADAAEARLRAENVEDSADKKKAEDWLVWARGYANEIDPVLNSVPALIYDKDFNEWEL